MLRFRLTGSLPSGIRFAPVRSDFDSRRFVPISVLLAGALIGVIHLFASLTSAAADQTTTPSPTLGDLVARSDVVCLAERITHPAVGKKGPTAINYCTATYNVVRVAKSLPGLIHPLDDFTLNTGGGFWRDLAETGDLFLLAGNRTQNFNLIDWSPPVPISEDNFNYAVHVPLPGAGAAKRLTYFAAHLDSSDAGIAADALQEIERLTFRQIQESRGRFSSESKQQFRQIFSNPHASRASRTLASRVLGICGDERDVRLFERQLAEARNGYRYRTQETISAYLLLAGETGLDKLDRWILRDPDVSAHDAHALLDAIVAVGDGSAGKTLRSRLLRSVRLLLDRPGQARHAIGVLAHWHDWSVLERLVRLYGSTGGDSLLIRREIVRYLIAASRNDEPGNSAQRQRASAYVAIEKLRRKDPAVVAWVERWDRGRD